MDPTANRQKAVDSLVRMGIDPDEAAEVIALTERCGTFEALRGELGEPDMVSEWDKRLEALAARAETRAGQRMNRWSRAYRWRNRWRTVWIEARECEGHPCLDYSFAAKPSGVPQAKRRWWQIFGSEPTH